MHIYYGIVNNYVDVTEICLSCLNHNNIITIPAGDHNRTPYFGDPLYGTLKKIFIFNNVEQSEYDVFCTIKINIIDNTITTTRE
jgi:hypothetical protein